MSAAPRRRIRVDWEELRDAFADRSSDHRYYLDRETGAVHFFSSYLDNEEEEEDERILTSEDRYVKIPRVRVALTDAQVADFVATLDQGAERRMLDQALRAPDGTLRFREAIEMLPEARARFERFTDESLRDRIEAWLSEVRVDPL